MATTRRTAQRLKSNLEDENAWVSRDAGTSPSVKHAAGESSWNALHEADRPLPDVHPALVTMLKFSEALPVEWAQEVIARRMIQ